MAILKNNQKKSNPVKKTVERRGGIREGAGRPKGSLSKARFIDYVSQKEVSKLVEAAKKQSYDKADLLKFVLEQIFGKARQSIGLDGGEEGMPILHSEIALKTLQKIKNDNLRAMGKPSQADTSRGGKAVG